MSDYFRRTEEMFRNGMRAGMPELSPEGLKVMAADGIVKSREATERMTAAAMEAGRAMEKATGVANSGAHALSEKVLSHFVANSQAAFMAAEAVVKAKSFPEAAQMQAEFLRTQMAKATEQTRELFELSNAIARTTVEQFASAARAFTPTGR